jgi:hypothetical protein
MLRDGGLAPPRLRSRAQDSSQPLAYSQRGHGRQQQQQHTSTLRPLDASSSQVGAESGRFRPLRVPPQADPTAQGARQLRHPRG